MSLSFGTLNPEFSSEVTEYCTSMGNEVESVSILPVPEDDSATVIVNGEILSDGETSALIRLEVGVTEVLIRVIAFGKSENTYKVSVTREDSKSLQAPQNVKATDGLADRITVSWNIHADAAGYDVLRQGQPGGGFEVIASNISASNFEDTGCVPGRLYTYKVRSVSAEMKSADSESDSGFVALADPLDFSASDSIEGLEIDTAWATVPGADYYCIERASTPEGGFVQVATSTATSYIDESMEYQVTYYYRVRAYAESAGIYSGYSNVDSGFCFLPAPRNIAASDGMSESVNVSWDPVPGAEKYDIFRTEQNPLESGSYTNIGYSTSASFDDTSACYGTVYYYRVASWDSAGGYSEQSSYDQGVRFCGVPQDVGASNGYVDVILLKWSKVDGATLYKVYRAAYDYGPYTLLGSTSMQFISDSRVQMGFYMVSASANGAGESGKSPYVAGNKGSYLNAPFNVSATDGQYPDKIIITWNAEPKANGGYEVYRSKTLSGQYVRIAEKTGNTYFHDTSSEPGIRYFYKIKSVELSPLSCTSGYSIYDTGYR